MKWDGESWVVKKNEYVLLKSKTPCIRLNHQHLQNKIGTLLFHKLRYQMSLVLKD